MPEPTLNQRWAATLVGALVGVGVRHAVIAPGSRSTPLAIALADRPDVKAWSVIDERSAAFFALGLSKATGTPAVVVCTSGTAGAHFLPAVMEAQEGGTPLVVLTADRPWELHGFGAPQTIPQAGLFGRYVRGAEALPTPDGEGLPHVAPVVAKLVHLAVKAPRGPVHLNVPFREPLAPPAGEKPLVIDPPWPRFSLTGREADLSRVEAAIASARRGLIVCGPRERSDDFGPWLHALSRRTGFPVLAEATSNARFGFDEAISLYDAVLRVPALAEELRPDVVLRFGGGLTAKGPQAWLDASGARCFHFVEEGAPFDPQHRAEQVLEVSLPVELKAPAEPPRAYFARWQSLNRQAAARLTEEPGALTEPHLARTLAGALPAGSNLFVSSSMPIRALDGFAAGGPPLRVFTNRGVNGIDGITSTALGVAAGTSRPTTLFIGDVALLHDLGGLLIAKRHGLSLTLVVVNNDGGGIFHFLPVASRTAHFEALFGTPHGVDLEHVAALAGATLHRPETLERFSSTVTACAEGGLHLVEVRTDRRANVEAHRGLYARLTEGLS
jgi:2-succinyl-5-enolpyruvyl-6-hydroxy-3-cyclohexene-1-carboxylate synthase